AAVVEATGAPAHLMGHSFGGLCALEAALLTQRVRRLIVYEPPIPTSPPFYRPGLLDDMERLLAAGRRDDVLETFMREVALQDPERITRQRRSPRWSSRVARAHIAVREVRASSDY